MPTVATPSQTWNTVKTELSSAMAPDIFQSWFTSVHCNQMDEEEVHLTAPTDFSAIWINDNFLDLIAQKFRQVTGRPLRVVIESSGRLDSVATTPVRREHKNDRRASDQESRQMLSTLNPRNTFEAFVVGSNSQLAHAAALAVAQSPAKAYNPLFLYGETGLGKTHLMHAVGHHVLHTNGDARIAYLSSEKFTNEYIQALQDNALTKFRQRYRHVDVLLLDDVQFLGGKERIQEEFFHTFNDLFESGKQIFLSSDRPASEISRLESRLVSRFQWGLMADIQSPDYETRVAILRSKAASLRAEIAPDVIALIAQHISRNIRRLEGALLKVISFSAFSSEPLDLATAENLLQPMFLEETQRQVTIEVIQKRVSEFFQLRPSEMVGRRRPANIAGARQIAMYLSRNLTRHSLQEIGEAFGGRDHGTVIHACRTVQNLMEQDTSVKNNIDFLRAQLAR